MEATKDMASTDNLTTDEMRMSIDRFMVKNVTAEERHHMISVAAYYRAEHRCCQGDCQTQDWLDAEIEIDRLLDTDPHLNNPKRL